MQSPCRQIARTPAKMNSLDDTTIEFHAVIQYIEASQDCLSA